MNEFDVLRVRATSWVAMSILVSTAVFCIGPASQSYEPDSMEGSDRHAPAGSSDPPTIEWFGPAENSTTRYLIMWDGMYTGQSEEVWAYEIWVNDTDGVDCVIFKFLWHGEWLDRPTVLVEGNETRGLYDGNLTYSVGWDWVNGHPSPPGSSFSFKVFANDTLGNWAETTTVNYMGGYLIIDTPIHYALLGTPVGRIVLGVSIFVAIGVICAIRKTRKRYERT